jgi:hypothetical protein
MAITTPEKRKKHIRGLREAAEKMLREERNSESKNFEIVADYFRRKAETRSKQR